MGIILGALAGAGKAVGEIADANTKLWGQQELEAQRAKLEESKAIAIAIAVENAKVGIADATRTKMVKEIDQGTIGIVGSKLNANNPVGDQSTWTPEQEAARNQGIVGMAKTDIRARTQAAVNAGYSKEGLEMDKIAESGASIVPWGSTRVDSSGNIIYDNASALKGEIAQQKANGKGAAKVDHFDAKEWNTAFGKMDKSAISIPNAMGDKEMPNHNLTTVWRQSFNDAKSAGEMAPNEAVAHADSIAGRFRDKAAERIAAAREKDQKSTRTIEQEIQVMLKEAQAFNQRQATPQPGKSPVPGEAGWTPGAKANAYGKTQYTISQDEQKQILGQAFSGAQTQRDVFDKFEAMAQSGKYPADMIAGMVDIASRDKRFQDLAASKAAGDTPSAPISGKEISNAIAQGKRRDAEVKTGLDQLANDTRIKPLQQKHSDALKRGKAVEANGYLAQINEIKRSYGL